MPAVVAFVSLPKCYGPTLEPEEFPVAPSRRIFVARSAEDGLPWIPTEAGWINVNRR